MEFLFLMMCTENEWWLLTLTGELAFIADTCMDWTNGVLTCGIPL
jgi:hypothetical protein